MISRAARWPHDTGYTMKAHILNVGITKNYFNAVSNQFLPMQSAACEPMDNILSNSTGPVNALVAFVPGSEKDLIGMVTADWGNGMDIDEVSESLQFGSRHTDEGPLCIHGVGLNNFLLVATRNKYPWFIATKKPEEDSYHLVDGPFDTKMKIVEQQDIPLADIVMRDAYKPLGAPSTIIYVEMDKSTASTMLTQNGSCAPSKVSSLNVLRRSIAEHFGVKYRNYLKPDDSGAAPARILIPDYQMANGKTCDVFVKPIFQRYKAVTGTHHLSVNYNGHDIPVSVEVGLLNAAATQTRAVTGGYALKHYYQGNMSTQGVDIQLGDRVIATAQLDTIWDRARHPSFNLFTGTIAIDISDLPRGFLNTLANKSNIDLSDEGWRAIFDAVKDAVPVVEDKTCPLEEYAKQFAERIMNNTGNKVKLQFPVYANRTRIDVLEYIDENHCNIYDFMSTAANMKSVAELRTHWDGMVSQGCQPVSATMFTTSRGPMLSHTCEELNSLIQSMPDDKMKAALKVAKGDVAKLPHYNLEIVVDKNLPR